MGCYVNPPNESKETFLYREGILVDLETPWQGIPEEMLPVILINIGGPFTAAGVAYDPEELEAFRRPDDRRPKIMFLVSIEKLLEVSDLKYFLKEPQP